MFLLRTLLPAPLITSPRIAACYVSRALDASVREPERVAAVRALHGVPFESALRDVVMRLVCVLNEPLWWLPSEVLSLVSFVRPVMHLGVVQGRFVASPSADIDLVTDALHDVHCPVIGQVVRPGQTHVLADRVPRLPWLHGSRGDL